MFHLQKFFKSPSKYLRNLSTKCSNILEKLDNRKILSVSGQEVEEYLQGLITNDIQHLAHGAGSMYAMFLNTKGRVMYDVIIYKMNQDKSFLIECDKQSLNSLQKHLKIYKVRRKIEVCDLTNDLEVYALYNIENTLETKYTDISNPRKFQGTIVPCTQLNTTLPSGSNTFKMYKDLAIFVDPRIVFLGNRIIAPSSCNIEEQLRELYQFNWSESKQNYQWFRYKLGIGEGINDLPPGNCFPLECNCDYLHGVSFHKGCYIGQELTARTHHTGVVRKRLMPLQFIKIPTGFTEELKIQKEGKRLGVLRGVKDDSGIALLKISEALEMKEIEIGNGLAKTERPFWWPVDTSKEMISQKE